MSATKTFLIRCSIPFCILFMLGQTDSVTAQHDFSKNSTTKKRVKPGPVAARIGTAVKWRESLEVALKESKESGKPVFWYVPTVKGTFMDRKDSIHRYMMAGPFSWPFIIDLLNKNFIPVQASAKVSEQKKYEVRPYVFVEPGFVILSAEDKVVAKIDRLSTLHPVWIESLIARFATSPLPEKTISEPLKTLWEQFARREYSQMKFNETETASVEEMLLAAMVEFRKGNHEQAKQKFAAASKRDPESPLAWKAAAEAEGFGPFVRGFEIFQDLPGKSQLAGVESQGSAAPVGIYDEKLLWKQGVDFMLDMQNEKGGWVDSDYDFGGSDGLPNVYVAVTSIAGLALINALEQRELTVEMRTRIENSIKRATQYVLDDKNMNYTDRDEILWAHAYKIRFLAKLAQRNPQFKQNLVTEVDRLIAIQGKAGGWFHEYPNPMASGLAMLALAEAADAGVSISQQSIEKGVVSLRQDRSAKGAYSYYSSGRTSEKEANPEKEEGDVTAAAGRMPLCELALYRHGASTDEALANAVITSFDRSKPLMDALKYDNHTSNHAYGGFFIWFDIESRGEAIARIKDDQIRSKYFQVQRDLILGLPELDGCFIDSHELGRVYGTAMGLISLARLRVAE